MSKPHAIFLKDNTYFQLKNIKIYNVKKFLKFL